MRNASVVRAGWLTLALAATLGWTLKFWLIEPDAVQALCTSATPPDWCTLRLELLSLTFPPRYGWIASGAALICWLVRGLPAAVFAELALAAGGLGLFLYDTGGAALGVLLALLRLPRVGEEPPDPREFSA